MRDENYWDDDEVDEETEHCSNCFRYTDTEVVAQIILFVVTALFLSFVFTHGWGLLP